jgi:hypothetical protein
MARKTPKTQDIIGNFFRTLVTLRACADCGRYVPEGHGIYPYENRDLPAKMCLRRVCSKCAKDYK